MRQPPAKTTKKIAAAKEMDSMVFHDRDTHTGEAIKYVLEHVFSCSPRGSAQMLVLITDGKANGDVKPQDAAAEAHEKGIDIVAVGVKVSDGIQDELLKITGSDPDKVLTVDNYGKLLSIVGKTAKKVCDTASLPPSPAPTPAPTQLPTPLPTARPTPHPTRPPNFFSRCWENRMCELSHPMRYYAGGDMRANCIQRDCQEKGPYFHFNKLVVRDCGNWNFQGLCEYTPPHR